MRYSTPVNRTSGDYRLRKAATLGGILVLLLLLFVLRYFLLDAQKAPKEIKDYITASTVIIEDLESYSLPEVSKNPYGTLSVPTYVNCYNGIYFLVDCYHDQIIYHSNLEDPLTEWEVFTSDINKGHTIVSDGQVYLVDDTENNRVLVFEPKDGQFVCTQLFEDIGNRPHYIQYDENTSTFYVWSSMSGEMFCFKHTRYDTRMYLTDIRKIKELDGVYVRSFTIDHNDIYFVSGLSQILKVDLTSFEIIKRYPVPDAISGMIQLMPIDKGYLITVSTDRNGDQSFATILWCNQLKDLEKGQYTDVYDSFVSGGTPYSLTKLGNTYYLTEHRVPGHSVWSFETTQEKLVNIKAVY